MATKNIIPDFEMLVNMNVEFKKSMAKKFTDKNPPKLDLRNLLTKIVLYSTMLYRSKIMIETRGGFLISQIKQIQGRVFARLLTEAGIDEFNGAQGRILYVLWQEDNLPIVELAARTGLAKTTLTGMLDRMESLGHIERRYDSEDRRQIRIRLTKSARRLEKKYRQVSDEMSRLFYKGFSEKEILELDSQLEKVLKNLEEEERKL